MLVIMWYIFLFGLGGNRYLDVLCFQGSRHHMTNFGQRHLGETPVAV